jgi:hypothetical protein
VRKALVAAAFAAGDGRVTIYDIDESARAAVVALFRIETPLFDPMPLIVAELPAYQLDWVERELRAQIEAMKRLRHLVWPIDRIYSATIWDLPDGPVRQEAIVLWIEIHKHIPGEQGPPLRMM